MRISSFAGSNGDTARVLSELHTSGFAVRPKPPPESGPRMSYIVGIEIGRAMPIHALAFITQALMSSHAQRMGHNEWAFKCHDDPKIHFLLGGAADGQQSIRTA